MRLIDADELKEAMNEHTDYKGYLVCDPEEIIDNAPTVERPHGEWIPCSERLPEECENVLGWIERNAWIDGSDYPKRKQEIAIGWHIKGIWHFDGYAGNTECFAWMPLPEPYKKEGGANEK